MRHSATALAVLLAAPAAAEVPRVLADTAPVHSLTALVMGDLGTPELIVPQGTSPHDASLSPSEAQALTEADLIVWTGDAFLPWMSETIASLAPDTPQLALLGTDGWEPLPPRASAHLEAEHEEDHGHEEEHGHEEHGEEHGHEHSASSLDPHAWLDPDVAVAWLGHISAALAEADPENAATYAANAARASESIGSMKEEMQTRLEPLSGTGYAVGHDAYQYLERAVGLPANWAVNDASGQDPAPRDAAALREAVLAGEVTCLLLDAETDPAWADTLGEGATLRTASVDPDGVNLPPGPDLYPTLLRNLADALGTCLSPQ
jgi:zinc transport system substrate-binding protein